MKTIREAASEYAKKYIKDKYGNLYWLNSKTEFVACLNDFIAGVKFSMQWTSVEENYPERNTPVLTKDMHEDNGYTVMIWDGAYWMRPEAVDYAAVPEVAHWRYIEFE